MQLPKKAIITVAGSGTRFLPATKAQPKEMLPIIDKPIIQYDVEEVVESGIKDIILVTKQGGRATEDHFDTNVELEQHLAKNKKLSRLEEVKHIAKIANFIYIRQKNHMPYGNGTPLLISKDLVQDGPFLYLYGDDMTKAKVPVCKQLIEVYKKNPDAAAIIATQRMPKKELNKYGVPKIKAGTKNELERLVEKPDPKNAPSQLASFGRYLLTPKILPFIEKQRLGKGGELWLADAIDELAKKEKVLVHEIEGEWFTTGDPLNYLKTTVEFALDRPDLKKEFRKYVEQRLKK